MNILVVSHYFWPEQFRINDLVRELQQRGHEVLVLTGMPNYPGGKLFEGYHWWQKRHDDMYGVPVYRTPMFVRREGRGWQLALNYLSFAVFGALLAPWYFRGKRFDAIFVYEPSPFTVGIPAIVMRHLKRAPMLFWVQDLWPESLTAAGAVHSPAVLKAVGRMVRWIYHHCDRVLVQSQSFIKPAVAAGADRSRTVFFPNWAESFYNPLTPAQAELPDMELPQGFRIMFAGNLGEAQSLETIIDAAFRLKHETVIQWIIIGDGRRQAWMREKIEQLGLGDCMTLPGRYAAETMPHFFAYADALLVTLKDEPVFAQTIPSKVQSYMACGKPVLAALNGEGARVVNEAGCGFTVAAEDGKALAEAVMQLYRLPAAQRQVMGIRGRAYYDRHFERVMLIDRLEQWMREVVEEGVCES